MSKFASVTIYKDDWNKLPPKDQHKIMLMLGAVVITERGSWLEDFSNTFLGFLMAVILFIALLAGLGAGLATITNHYIF